MRALSLAFLLTFLTAGYVHGNEQFEKNGWNYQTIVDPFTDKSRYLVSKLTDEKTALAVKCDEVGSESLYLSIISDNYIGSKGDRYAAQIRIDKNPLVEHRIYSDGSLAHILDKAIVRNLLQQLVSGATFYFRATSYDYEHANAVIDLNGSNDAILWVNEKCQAGMLMK